MKKKNSDINIKNISGNVIVSQGQKGGVTTHENILKDEKPKGKSFFKNKYVLLTGLIASVLGILTYFGLQPESKSSNDGLIKTTEIPKSDTVKTSNDTFKQKPISPLIMKKSEVGNQGNEKPISVKNVSGDVVISQNQSGGITAHTVNINKASKRSISNSISEIVQVLKNYPIAAYRLEYTNSDPEINNLAMDIDKMLIGLNWQRFDPIIRLAGPQHPPGIIIYSLKSAEPIISLANQLWTALGNKGVERQIVTDLDNIFKIHGWPPKEIPADRNGVVIIIGTNPEN